MKKFIITSIKKLLFISGFMILPTACINNDELLNNPNTIPEDGVVPPSLLLNRLTSHIVEAGEFPFKTAHKYNQYIVSNYSYYWGSSFYNWTNSEDLYQLVLYSNKLEFQNQKTSDENQKKYYNAVAKFFKAYSYIWLSQRVGDIPVKEAANSNILKPSYDSQKDVYAISLQLLEDANTLLNGISESVKRNVADPSGDIYGLTYLQWQKTINAFRLRTLISLSKRADDTPELSIKESFAKILSNPSQYPLLDSNSDNLKYVFNRDFNPYPVYTQRSYTYGVNMGKTLLDLTTANRDPRTFAFATPAPQKYNVEKIPFSDFNAYVGVSNNLNQADIFKNTDTSGTSDNDKGPYSYINYKRYFSSQDGSTAEPYTIIGYSEMCFNIAEAINRGWVSGDANTWYINGINSSLDIYGLKNGQAYTIGDRLGKTLGEVVINTTQFLNNSNVVYKGNNAQGLEQILQQKYVSLFCNSGYEAFYNWRRTGYPKFEYGGDGIGTANKNIPLRWLYPQSEITYNSDNYNKSIQSQYGGVDDTFYKMWILK